MRRNRISVIPLILAIIMIVGILASCGTVNMTTTTYEPEQNPTEAPTNQGQSEDTSTEDSTEKNTNDTTEQIPEDVNELGHVGYSEDLIKKSNELADGVQAYFENAKWFKYIVENRNMSLKYTVCKDLPQYIDYIKNT